MKTIDLIKEMILNFLDNPSSNLDQFNHCNMILIKILTRILINYQENNFLLFGQAEVNFLIYFGKKIKII